MLRYFTFGLLWCLATSASAQDSRDATRLEVGERYCFHDAACLAAVRRDVAAGRPIQWVIYSMLGSLYADSPENAERACESATRAIAFTNDFLSGKEWTAGQTVYLGARTAELRQTLARYAGICENRISWLAKYHCLEHALFPLLPGQYHPELVPIDKMPWK